MNHKTSISYYYDSISYDLEFSNVIIDEVEKLFPTSITSTNNEIFSLSDYHQPTVTLDVLLTNYSVEKTATGKNYLKLTFSTAGGSIPAKMWDNGQLFQTIECLESSKSNVFYIEAKVEEYPPASGNNSLTLTHLEDCSRNVPPYELLPTTNKNILKLATELMVYINELDEPFQSIAKKSIEKWSAEFSTKAAAKRMHHAFIGGLLEHTVGLLRFIHFLEKAPTVEDGCITLSKIAIQESCRELFYSLKNNEVKREFDYAWSNSIDHIQTLLRKYIIFNQETVIDFNVIKLAVLLHDFGKILEYTHYGENYDVKWKSMFPTSVTNQNNLLKPTGINIDTIGGYIGHIPLSMMMLQTILAENNIEISLPVIGEVMHCIAAHHGKIEWGSSAQLATVNAIIVHYVDFLDSRYGGQK